jgi:hypothetical protein
MPGIFVSNKQPTEHFAPCRTGLRLEDCDDVIEHELFRLPALHHCGKSCRTNKACVVFYRIYVKQFPSINHTKPNQTNESDDVVDSGLNVESSCTTG